MTQVNPVDAAIAAAEKNAAEKNAAEKGVASQGAIVEMTAQGSPQNGVQAYAAPAPVTFDDLSGGMVVDSYLKMTYFGMQIGTREILVQGPIKVRIDMAEITPFEGIRFGNPATYYKTYDRLNAVSGGTWTEAVNRAKKADPKSYIYHGVDIQMTLLEDVKNGNEVIAEEGTRLGYSTPPTAKANMKLFVDSVKAAGLINSAVEVELGYDKKENKGGNKWGLITLKLIGEAE